MDTRLQTLATLFTALADPTRLRILRLLANGEVCVCRIHETLAVPQPKASRHLAYLRRAGLVDTRREGLWVHYRLAQPDDPAVASVLSTAIHALGHAPTTARDQERLTKKLGLRANAANALPVISCCGTVARLGRSPIADAVRR